MKKWTVVLLVTLLLLLLMPAMADIAPEILTGITFTSNARSKNMEDMLDDSYSTYYPLNDKNGWLEIHSEEPVYGIFVMLFDKFGKPVHYELQLPDSQGGWRAAAEGGKFLCHWHRLPEGVTAFRIAGTSRERVRIAELRLFGEGEKPADVQDWTEQDKCDLMLLTAHPDDELLWFGGLLPVYAGERMLRVQLTVMVPTGGERKLELLSAIWHCGVKAYPDFLGLVDKNGRSVDNQYMVWRGMNRVIGLVVRSIRQHQPEVMITHGEKGEYGHGAHKAACDAAKIAVSQAADSRKYAQSKAVYGVWRVKKLYLHEYSERKIICDWNHPLQAFGGKTGYEVANEAFAFHRSQVQRNWSFQVHGEHDNAVFGLYYTEVGRDTGIGDLMEHIRNNR